MTVPARLGEVRDEVDRATAALAAAEALLALGFFDDAVSRFYYAAFHHVRGLLLSVGLETKSHAGTHALLYVHFVKPGLLPAGVAQRYAELQRYREQADYSALMRCTEETARDEAAHAREICRAIYEHLRSGGWIDGAEGADD